MAHDLDEVDDFAFPVVVPDGVDSRSNAAEVVQGIAQVLANRTFMLLLHSAFKDQSNHFTSPNEFDLVVNATKGMQTANPVSTEAALTVGTNPDDDPNAGNRWKAIVQAAVGGALSDVIMWSGIPTHDAQLLFTVNAYWNPVTQRWAQQNASRNSVAVLVADTGTVTISRVNSGSAVWAQWPLGGSTQLRVNTLTLSSTGLQYSAAQTVTCHRDVRAGRATPTANVVYTPAGGTAPDSIRATTGTLTIDVPLDIPVGAKVTRVRALMTSPTTELVSLDVFLQTPNYGTPGAFKASMRSGGAVSVSGGGADAAITYTPNQNDDVTGLQSVFARITVEVNAYVYCPIEVTYTTSNARHF